MVPLISIDHVGPRADCCGVDQKDLFDGSTIDEAARQSHVLVAWCLRNHQSVHELEHELSLLLHRFDLCQPIELRCRQVVRAIRFQSHSRVVCKPRRELLEIEGVPINVRPPPHLLIVRSSGSRRRRPQSNAGARRRPEASTR